MMSKYYLITLKNARAYEARDVLCNGLPVAGLHMLVGQGRLQFLASPAVHSNGQILIGGFKSMSGIDAEFVIFDPAIPSRRCTLKGRVISAITQPGGAVPANSETITIEYSKVEYKL
jgi:hypothetical protein